MYQKEMREMKTTEIMQEYILADVRRRGEQAINDYVALVHKIFVHGEYSAEWLEERFKEVDRLKAYNDGFIAGGRR